MKLLSSSRRRTRVVRARTTPRKGWRTPWLLVPSSTSQHAASFPEWSALPETHPQQARVAVTSHSCQCLGRGLFNGAEVDAEVAPRGGGCCHTCQVRNRRLSACLGVRWRTRTEPTGGWHTRRYGAARCRACSSRRRKRGLRERRRCFCWHWGRLVPRAVFPPCDGTGSLSARGREWRI